MEIKEKKVKKVSDYCKISILFSKHQNRFFYLAKKYKYIILQCSAVLQSFSAIANGVMTVNDR